MTVVYYKLHYAHGNGCCLVQASPGIWKWPLSCTCLSRHMEMAVVLYMPHQAHGNGCCLVQASTGTWIWPLSCTCLTRHMEMADDLYRPHQAHGNGCCLVQASPGIWKWGLVMTIHFCHLFYGIGWFKGNQFNVPSNRIGLPKHCMTISSNMELEQLERLHSEDTPGHLMITHTIESY